MALEEAEESQYSSDEQQLDGCYQLGTFRRFASFWGLVDMGQVTPTKPIWFEYEVQAPRLSDWLQFHV